LKNLTKLEVLHLSVNLISVIFLKTEYGKYSRSLKFEVIMGRRQ
jgi:hypothetical protein